ncbi:MAG TPA: D-glycero-beta-D-manno-heptose 1-phosphate adenylyltransferase [Candidatus Binatia bacterium]
MPDKVQSRDQITATAARAKTQGKKIVFTNGCFDLLHVGHLRLLRQAKKLGNILIVALNSDRSVRENKGVDRPIVSESERAELIAALEMVDYVTLFDEPDPIPLLREIKPDVLVKGGDWGEGGVVGRELVESWGGKVAVIPYLEGHSTTNIIKKVERTRKQSHGKNL